MKRIFLTKKEVEEHNLNTNFIIERVEIIPFEKYTGNYQWYDFKKYNDIPEHIVKHFEDLIKNSKEHDDVLSETIEFENKVYQISNRSWSSSYNYDQVKQYLLLNLSIGVAESLTDKIKNTINSFQVFLDSLIDLTGKKVCIKDLDKFMTNEFKNFSRPRYHIDEKENQIKLHIVRDGGRDFDYYLAHIATIYCQKID